MHKGKYATIVIYLFITIVFPLVSIFISNRPTKIPDKLIPQVADKFSKEYLALLKQGDIEKAFSLTSAQYKISEEQLVQIAPMFSNLKLETVEIIGASSNYADGVGTFDLTYELINDTPDKDSKYAQVEVVSVSDKEGVKLAGVHIRNNPQSIKELNKIDLSKQWIYLVLAFIIPLLIAYTAIRYLKKSANPKWTILLVILLASIFISVPPSTFKIAVGIFGFIQKEGLWGPLIFEIPIPIGVIYYYVSRRKYENKDQVIPNS